MEHDVRARCLNPGDVILVHTGDTGWEPILSVGLVLNVRLSGEHTVVDTLIGCKVMHAWGLTYDRLYRHRSWLHVP